MKKVALEKCLDKSANSVYKLTIMVARRAQELAEGAKPLVDTYEKDRPLIAALEEIAEGHLRVEKNNKKSS